MARRVPVVLELDAASYLAEARAVKSETAAVDRQMNELDRSIDKVDRDMAELSATATLAGRRVDNLGDQARGTAASMTALDARIKATRLSVRELGLEFARTGEKADGTAFNREKSLLGRLERLKKTIEELSNTASSGVSAAVPDAPGGGGLPSIGRGGLIGAAVGLGVALAPTLGAIISGAVVGTVAGGGIIGGIFAAAHDSRVQMAWQSTMSDVFTADAFGAEAFVDPVVTGIGTIKTAIDNAHIGETLALGAPAVDELADGISGFVTNIMPGFEAVMADSESITGVFGAGISDTGDAISDLITDLLKSKGTLEGLHAGFIILNGTIRAIGGDLRWLGDRFDWLARQTASVTGGLEDFVRGAENVERATTQFLTFGLIDVENHNLSESIARINDNMEDVTNTAPLMASGLNGTIDPSHHAAFALGEFGDAAWTAEAGMEELNHQILSIFGANLDAEAAADQLNTDILALKESVTQYGTSLDENTTAGLKNRTMLRGLVEDAMAHYEANIKAGMSAQDAKAKYEEEVTALQTLATNLGYATEGVAALIGQYKNLPTVVTTEFRSIYTSSVGGYGGGEHSGLGDSRDRGFQAFDTGGFVQGPPGSAQMVIAHAGELVLTKQQQQTAVQWNGGGGGATTVRQEHVVNLLVNGRELRQLLITDALDRNQSNTTVSVAYP